MKNSSKHQDRHFIVVGIALAVLYWIIEAAVHAFILHDGSFAQQLFAPDAHALWVRSLVAILVIPFGVYAYVATIRRTQAETVLRERNKELNCLYGISSIVESSPEADLDELLQDVVNILPGSWQYPDIASARIIVDDREYASPDSQQSQWCQSADIRMHGEVSGAIRVCYHEERPEADEGPFSKEERRLIETVAERLGHIIERKQTEEELRESEERFRVLFDTAVDAIFLADPQTGMLLDANEAAANLTGHTHSELLQMHQTQLHPPDKVEQYKQMFARHIEQGRAAEFEAEVIRKDDSTVPVYISAVLTDIAGRQVLQGRFVDITARKRAEQELQAAHQRNETILRTSMDGVMIMGPDGSIIECNEAFCEIAGYSQDELLAMKIGDLVAQMTAEDVGEVMQQVMQAGSHRFESAIRHKDGTLVDLEVAATLVELRENEFIVSFARDITETKKLWQELNHQLVRDTLTGVYNRRYFNETIIQEIKRADRYGHHVSFIMGDIDDLKAVNDNCGHLVGDQILQGVAHALDQTSRAADVVIRYGGDEFLVVMPETGTEQAHVAVERFQQAFADWLDQRARDGALPPDLPADLGFSMGVACYEPGTDVAVEEVLAQADQAMYRTKQAKRAKRATA